MKLTKIWTRTLLTLLVMACPTVGAWAARSWQSGGCTVTLDNGTMTVRKSAGGNGLMASHEGNEPWTDYVEDVKTLIVEEGVMSINEWNFQYLYKMTSLSLPKGLKSIGRYAFQGCSALKSITIPSSVTEIDEGAFFDCGAVTDVYCLPWADRLTWQDGRQSFKSDKSTVMHVQAGELAAYQQMFANQLRVQFVGDQANLEKPAPENIPIDAAHFEDESFRNYLKTQDWGADGVITPMEIAGIKKLFPDDAYSLKGIEYFTELEFLMVSVKGSELDLSKNVKLKTLRVTRGNLTTLDLSKNVNLTYIDCFCNKLSGAYMDAFIESLPTVENGQLWIIAAANPNEKNVCTVDHVAAAKLKGWTAYNLSSGGTYKGSPSAAAVGDVFTEGSFDYVVTNLNPNTVELKLCRNSNQDPLVIPATVPYCGEDFLVSGIVDETFYFVNLNSVILPEGMWSIGKKAFNFSTLTSINIPSSVTQIWEGAFRSCSKLSDVYCYANPNTLHWMSYSQNFMPDKATKFHVTNVAAWEQRFPDLNVTFVEMAPQHDCSVDGHVWGEDGACEICGEVSDKKPRTIDLAKVSADTTAKDGDVLTGTLGADVKISIADGATVTLSGVTIDGGRTVEDRNAPCPWAGITCLGDATLILEGVNWVRGFHYAYPGIQAGPQGTKLTIKGNGSLTAQCGNSQAGIGGGVQIDCGDIVIEGGNIKALAGEIGAGIGSGYESSCGDITISGGTVEAMSLTGGAGIGCGTHGSCGNITITDGITQVVAKANVSMTGAHIGRGYDAVSYGTITISPNLDDVIDGETRTLKPKADAIESIAAAGTTDGAWYTLSGVKLEGEPTAPGIYVKDNKKVIVRE